MGSMRIRSIAGRRAGLALLALGLLAPTTGLPGANAPARAQSATCPAVAVPAYFDDPAEWGTMVAAPRVDIVIFNPASGPGKRRLDHLADQVAAAQASGATVLGYVRTGLGKRKAKTVRREIRRYWAWYGVDGIHFDEVHNMPRRLPYYRKLSQFVRGGAAANGGGGFVMINPGWTPDRSYMEIADLVENFEWHHRHYAGHEFPDWVHEYPATRFAHVVHDVPPDQLQATLAEARANNAGYVFVTDRSDPRQYKALPGIWDATLRNLCR
jgi:hypothetical protein